MWYSILVSTTILEGGAKNPSKGISMKFFMLGLRSPVVGFHKE